MSSNIYNDAAEKLYSCLEPVIESIVQSTIKLMNAAIEAVTTVFEEAKKILESPNFKKLIEMYSYPNKRIVHLALYHPKERVRNKNINRIIKTLKLEEKRKKR